MSDHHQADEPVSKRQQYYDDWHLKRKSHRKTLYKRLTTRFYISRNEVVASLVDSGDRILDVGCGEGFLIGKILPKFKECYGVDFSHAALERADEMYRGKVAFSQCDLDSAGLDFGDQFFDCVTCVATLEHLFDPIFAMEEIIRVAKPGGQIILHVPNLGYLRHRLHLLVGKRPRTSYKPGWDGGHLQYFTSGDFREFLPDRGVRIDRIIGGAGRFMGVRNVLPSLLAADLVVACRKNR